MRWEDMDRSEGGVRLDMCMVRFPSLVSCDCGNN